MVEYIEINGIKYPIIVNFYVIGEFQKETGYTLDIFQDIKNRLFLIEPLFWHSLRIGHLIAKQELKVTREDLPILLSDNKSFESFVGALEKFFPEGRSNTKTAKKK